MRHVRVLSLGLCWLVSSIIYTFVKPPRQMTRGNPRGGSILRLVLTKTQGTAINYCKKRDVCTERGMKKESGKRNTGKK